MQTIICDLCQYPILNRESAYGFRLTRHTSTIFSDPEVCETCAGRIKDVRAHLKSPLQVPK